MAGFVVWFTGLSGSGKSTLAAMLSAELRARGVHVEVLDGDEVRTHLSKGLTFSKEDRDTNVRRIGFGRQADRALRRLRDDGGEKPLPSDPRDEQRASIPAFCEVYCECPVPALTARDPKGLYLKALAGEIRGFSGVDDPYEAPERPEVTVHTERETKEESLAKILARLVELGFVAQASAVGDASRGAALVSPHGGELVNRYASVPERAAIAERAKGLPRVTLDERALLDLQSLASGAFSPLRGFMNQKDYLRVVREMRLENGLPWAHPITLPIAESEAETIRRAREIALQAPDGSLAGVLEVTDVYRRDRDLEARAPFGGITSELENAGSFCVGGEIWALELPTAHSFTSYRRTPLATRASFTERGWSRVVGFADPAPILRAHEYLAKSALEIADGLLLGVLHETAGEALSEDLRVRCAEAMALGYFPSDRVLLAVHDGLWRRGARRPLAEAIVQKNYGCSLVVASHAADSKSILQAFSASELGISSLTFEEAFYSTKTQSMATSKTAPGDVTTRVACSVEAIVAAIARGETPESDVVRPEVLAVLRSATLSK